MKTPLLRHPRPSGHVLLTTLVVMGVVGVVLVACLRMIQSEATFTTRTLEWNNCMGVAEAGVEEAMSHLNKNSATNLALDGWVSIGAQTYERRRQVADGYYRVVVVATNLLAPVVTSSGYVPAPMSGASAATSALAVSGAAVPSSARYISRTVQVMARTDPLLPRALAVRNTIDLGGNSCMVDSYNSSVAPYSAATAGDKGDVSTDADIVGSLDVGNAKIKGKLSTGPRSRPDLGPNGSVGSVSWVNGGNKGIQKGWLSKGFNMSFPDVAPPFSGGVFAPTGNATNKYVLTSGNYQMSSLALAGGEKMLVRSNAVLYVTGDVTISGDIEVANGNTFQLYIGGASGIFSGTYTKSDVASEFFILGLPSCTSLSVKGIAGVVYAPQARLTILGNAEFYGASVTDSLRMNGTTGYHYDEALANLNLKRGFVITSWAEL